MNIKYPTFRVNKGVSTALATSTIPRIKLLPLPYSTCIMYDPDSSKPSWVHYLVTNIPNGDITKGDVVLPYMGPSPPPGTGTHHYIFEQLEQKSPYTVSVDRSGLDVDAFKKENNVTMRATAYFLVNA